VHFSDANTTAAAPTMMLATTSAVVGQTIRHANQSRNCHHRIVPKKLPSLLGES
jgi:hypothetical protein